MGKPVQCTAAKQRAAFLVVTGYCDGSKEVRGFRLRSDANKLFEAGRAMLVGEPGLAYFELRSAAGTLLGRFDRGQVLPAVADMKRLDLASFIMRPKVARPS